MTIKEAMREINTYLLDGDYDAAQAEFDALLYVLTNEDEDEEDEDS